MNNIPTIKELLADVKRLRLAAGEVLNPGTWGHRWMNCAPSAPRCLKCGDRKPMGIITESATSGCSVPDPAEGPLEVVAERLVKLFAKPNLDGLKLWDAITYVWSEIHDGSTIDDGQQLSDLMWFILWATPTERIVCCLLALGKARIDEQNEKP